MITKYIKDSVTYYIPVLSDFLINDDGSDEWWYTPIDAKGNLTTFDKIPNIFREKASAVKWAVDNNIYAEVIAIDGDKLKKLIDDEDCIICA